MHKHEHLEEEENVPETIIRLSKDKQFFGRINAPDGSAQIKGECGDTVEVYLMIKGDVIIDVKYFTDGCAYSKACAATMAEEVIGRTIDEALCVCPQTIIDKINCLPEDHRHCAILAMNTFYNAISDYWFRIYESHEKRERPE